MSETKSREWLLYNAVLAWIHNYAKLEGTLAEQYVSLRQELEDEQSKNTETRKRGRPAKRQRTSKASSNSSSTEKNQTTNQEA